MTSDIDDFLNGDKPKTSPELMSALKTLADPNFGRPRRPGRPTLAESEQYRKEREAALTGQMPRYEEIRKGVSVTFLMAMFNLERETCRAKLRDCPRVGVTNGNTPLYNFQQAAAYLVRAKFDLKTIKKSDLAPELQDSVWSALLKKQKWEEKAGHLWRTSAVLTVFSETFLLIKNTVQLWSEDARLAKTLTDEQRTALIEMTDGLLKDVYDALVQQSKDKATRSQIAELTAEGEVLDEDLLV